MAFHPVRPAALARFPKAEWNASTGRWVEGEFWYDEATAEKAVAFFTNHLRLTEGEWAGKPFILEGWQANDIVRPVFGWKRADGTRRFRRCIIWVPRKNGKTELAAGLALLTLLGDAEPGAQVFSIAKDKSQAELVFNKACAMANHSAELTGALQVLKTALYCPSINGSFRPLTGSPKGKHGLSMHGMIGDEVHEWPDSDLYTFVHQSSGARRQPLEFLISTAGQRRGFGWELWEHCERVREGGAVDAETHIVTYAADPEDDWTDPAVWAKANPNLGVSLKFKYLESECARAKDNPRLENDFKRYHLNIWTEQATRWIALHKWDECIGDVPWADLPQWLAGKRCFGGVDLSSKIDLAAKVLTFPPQPGLNCWAVVPSFYVPEERIPDRVKTDRVPYDRWERMKALKATGGNVIDYDYIKADILRDARAFELISLGFDPWNALQIMLQMQAEAINAVEVRQGFITLSGPSKELESFVVSQKLQHGGHPILRWCAGNVAADEDAAGNIKPSKAKSTERIDGIAGLVTGLALALSHVEEEAPVSPWDDPNYQYGS